MKTLGILLSCLLFIITTHPLLSSAQSTPVLDTDGNALQAGVDYYAVPPAGSNTGGGGLGLQSRVNISCPLDVVQVLNQTSNGLPLRFSPVNNQTVSLGTDLNVQFDAVTICASANVWRLVSDDNLPNLYYVSTGGVLGNPGRETLSNWFGIQRYEDAYMFYFCPTVCDTCRPVCGNIGVVIFDSGRRLLGLSNQPLKVAFKKA